MEDLFDDLKIIPPVKQDTEAKAAPSVEPPGAVAVMERGSCELPPLRPDDPANAALPAILIEMGYDWGSDESEMQWTPEAGIAVEMIAAGETQTRIMDVTCATRAQLNSWCRKKDFAARVNTCINDRGITAYDGLLAVNGHIARTLLKDFSKRVNPDGSISGLETKDGLKILQNSLNSIDKMKRRSTELESGEKTNIYLINFANKIQDETPAELRKRQENQRAAIELTVDEDGVYG